MLLTEVFPSHWLSSYLLSSYLLSSYLLSSYLLSGRLIPVQAASGSAGSGNVNFYVGVHRVVGFRLDNALLEGFHEVPVSSGTWKSYFQHSLFQTVTACD